MDFELTDDVLARWEASPWLHKEHVRRLVAEIRRLRLRNQPTSEHDPETDIDRIID